MSAAPRQRTRRRNATLATPIATVALGDARAPPQADGFAAAVLMPDFDARWTDPVLRADMLDVARKLEAEPSIVGASAHLMAVGRT